MAKKREEKQKEVPICGECVEGEIYTAFHTLSVKGEPTMKSCPYTSHKRLLSERVKDCVHYKRKRR